MDFKNIVAKSEVAKLLKGVITRFYCIAIENRNDLQISAKMKLKRIICISLNVPYIMDMYMYMC